MASATRLGRGRRQQVQRVAAALADRWVGLPPRADATRAARTVLELAVSALSAREYVRRRLSDNLPELFASHVDRLVAGILNLVRPGLRVEDLRVSRGSDVSLRLTGPADLLESVRSLAAVDCHGRVVEVPTSRARDGGQVWLAGALDLELLGRRSTVLHLLSVHGHQIPIRVPDRSRLGHRWSARWFARHHWPLRVAVGLPGRLTALGVPPPDLALWHEVGSDGRGITITWGDEQTASSVLRLVRGSDGTVTCLTGARALDGRHQVRLEPDQWQRVAGTWRIEVLRAGGPPTQLAATNGSYPPMSDLVDYPQVQDDNVVLRVGYAPSNTLVLRVKLIDPGGAGDPEPAGSLAARH